MNAYQLKLQALEQYYAQFERAEGDPNLQNSILRAMTYTADRLFINTVDFILSKKATPPLQLAPAIVATSEQPVAAPEPPVMTEGQNASFCCRKCGRAFANVKQLNAHQKAHRQPAPQ